MGRTDKTLGRIFPDPRPFLEFPERAPYILEAPTLAPSWRMEKWNAGAGTYSVSSGTERIPTLHGRTMYPESILRFPFPLRAITLVLPFQMATWRVSLNPDVSTRTLIMVATSGLSTRYVEADILMTL
jgi:hypothetical protein